MTLEPALLTALATGVIGSAHCSAMCGPLAVAGCSRGGGVAGRDAAAYFLGRLVAYACVGAVMGHLGRHALCILPMEALENVAVAAVATLAIARGVALLRTPRPPLVTLRRRREVGPLRALVASLWPRRGLGLGLATAVLPCGLLVPAWALAAGSASAPEGALVMATFALATAPGLVLPLAGKRLLQRVAMALPERAHGFLWCALGAWIAVRPLLVARGACHF